MAESKLSQHASVKRKIYQWLLKMYRDEALEGIEQMRPQAPDVAELVELLRGAGYRLSSVDIGANSSTASAGASTSTGPSGTGCHIIIKCQRSGLCVSMEATGDPECRCADSGEDHSASTWSVFSSQENLSRLEVGSSLLPPLPPDVCDLVGSAVSCAVRVLREWPSARAPAPPALLSELPRASPSRPAPLPPLMRPMSAEGAVSMTTRGGMGERRPFHLSLDAAQWSAAGARGTPTPPLLSTWGPSVSPLPSPRSRTASPSMASTPPSDSPLPAPDVLERPPHTLPQRHSPHRPFPSPTKQFPSPTRDSPSSPRRSASPTRAFRSPPRSHSEEPPPLPPRRHPNLYTLDDYLAMKRAEKRQQEQEFFRFSPPQRPHSANDIVNISLASSVHTVSPRKLGPSEPRSLKPLQEEREILKLPLVIPTGPGVVKVPPKSTKVFINDASDFVNKAEGTIRQIGILMQSIKKWVIAREEEEEEMTEPLVKQTAEDTTESDSSERAVKKHTKGSGKKGTKKLPALPSKVNIGGSGIGTARPTGPSSRFSDSVHPQLARMGKVPIPTRTFVRPKKDQWKNQLTVAAAASAEAVSRETSRSSSENEAGSRRRTICTTTLPPTAGPLRAGAGGPFVIVRSGRVQLSARDAQFAGSSVRGRATDAKTKGALPRQPRGYNTSEL